ncbi:Uncharacterized protein dnl_30650 [Desulfonema limicola]|uniref:Uncharacterized protein n=1 Tax=Desulfonema limicola TaxID=45656 RepID=A0A975B8H5_9BACT|nr:Uncharacterized protein dnl_30650 [Desulfonema limicola]
MFSWKYNCEALSGIKKDLNKVFQSLFSWKYNCEPIKSNVEFTGTGFNPCFHGSTTVRGGD